MAAPLGFKTFATGDVLSAADTNGYLMQGILVFADAAARSAAITSPQEGQSSYLKDTDAIQVYDGSAWVTKSITGSGGPTFVGCYAYITTNGYDIPNSTYTNLTFDGERFDTDGFHTTGGNNERITIPAGKAGKYMFKGAVTYDASGTGQRTLVLTVNGSRVNTYSQIHYTAPTSGGYSTTVVEIIVDAAVGDYFALQTWQNSGGNLYAHGWNFGSTAGGGAGATFFQCTYLGA